MRTVVRFLAVFLLGLYAPAAHAQNTSEQQFKAAFLFNLTKFVDWPEQIYASSGNQIRICVLAAESLAGILERTVQGERVGGRAVVVQRFTAPDGLRGCQVAYIENFNQAGMREALEALQSAGTLTVGESPAFVQMGGMLAFSVERNRLRFDANKRSIDASPVRVSSRLLRLARNVYSGP
jgi:hypothetical protein